MSVYTQSKKFNIMWVVVFLLSVAIIGVNATTYYSQSTGNFDASNIWNTASDGSGSSYTASAADQSSHDFIIQSGNTITLAQDNTQVGSLTINSGGTFAMSSNGYTFVCGALSVDGTFSGGDGTVHYYLGASANFNISTNLTIYNLIIDGATFGGTKTLTLTRSSGTSTYTLTISNELKLINKGGFAVGANTAIVYSAATLTFANGADYTIQGEWPASNGPDNVIFNTSNTVTYNLSTSVSANNITLDGGGNFTINNSSATVTVNALLTRKTGSITVTSGTLAYSTAELAYTSDADVTIGDEWVTGSGAPQDVTITITNDGILSGSASYSVARNLDFNVGSLNLGTGHSLTVLGNITGSTISGTSTINDNTTLVIGNGATGNSYAQSITGSITLNKLTIDKRNGTSTAANTVSLSGTGGLTFTANSTLQINNGVLNFAGKTVDVTTASNTLNIASTGTLRTGGTSLSGFETISASSGTIVFDGSSSAETAPVLTVGTLTINNGSGVNLSVGTTTVNTALTLTSGLLTTSSGNILVVGTSTVTGSASSYVNGPLRMTINDANAHTFPIGVTGKYRPATFQYSDFTGGSNEVLEMQYVASDPGGTAPSGISTISSAGHYTLKHISGTAPSSVTHNLTLRYTDTGFSPESRNRILVQNSATPTYTVPSSQSQNETNDDVTATGITALPTNDGKLAFGAGGATVTAQATGNWNTAATWDINSVPTSSDDVVIGSYTVTVQSGNTASANSLTLNNGARLILANAAPGIGFQGTTNWDATQTTINSGSTVEYQAGRVNVDAYADLTINGAGASNGSGTITVSGNLIKNSGTAFTASHDIIVSGTYTNTLGDMTFTSSTSNRIDGNVTLTSGTVSGTLDLNSAIITINGGSFGGTVTLSGTGVQTINGSGSPSFANLTINNANGITISTATSVSGTLTLTSGLVNTSSALLTLGSGASVSGGSATSFINGPMAHTGTTGTKVFPIGKGSEYRWVDLSNITTPGTDPVLQVEMFPSDPGGTAGSGLNNISTIRYWTVSLNSGQLSGYTARLHWEDNDGVDGALSDLRVASSSSSNGTYVSEGGTSSGDAASGYVTSNAISTTGTLYLTLGSAAGDNSLPVELVSFEATAQYNKVDINWSTASELNNRGFNIYRAETDNPDNWVMVNDAMIDGQGSVSTGTNYNFTDTKIVSGKTYQYKLESVSLNGITVEEKTIDVEIPVPSQYALLPNYPNPFNPTTNIKFLLPESQQVTLQIYNISGQLVKTITQNQMYQAGEHVVTWNADDESGSRVASGMYMYVFRAGSFHKIGKMILLK